MRWRTTRWKVCTTKCSSENIALLCPKNPPWQPRSPAQENYWNTERNRVGCRARLGDDKSFGLRLASGESGAEGEEERIANRSRSATPLPSGRRKPPAFAAHA